jgi:hypothetical protein
MVTSDELTVTVEWGHEQRGKLNTVLRGKPDPERIATIIAKAGAAELLAMATGEHVPETMVDLQKYRIFRLIKAGMTLPEAESMVADIFQIPLTRARGRVKDAIHWYSADLRDQVDDAIRDLLMDAEWSKKDQHWEVSIPWEYVRESLMNVLTALGQTRPTKTTRGSLYAFLVETYQMALEYYDLPDRPSPLETM